MILLYNIFHKKYYISFKRNKEKDKMSIKKTLDLTNRQQLVDLNDETTNFDLTFHATSKDGKPFDALVVDQTTLDNNPNLEFKRANGTISGNIVSDKNVYQNYFLCLKSDQPCQVDITIDKKEITPRPPSPQPKHFTTPSLLPPSKPNGTNWKFVVILLLIIGGIILFNYFYNKKENSITNNFATDDTVLNNTSQNSTLESSTTSSSPSTSSEVAPSPPVTNFGFGGKRANESLIARLNSLPLK